MTIGERIKKLRKDQNLTQQSFAEKMKLKQNTITRIETGNSSPSPAVISLICRTFNVKETWLKTGEGEMFLPEGEQILLNDARLDEFDRSIISSYINAPDEIRKYIKEAIMDAVNAWEKAQAGPQFTEEELAIYEKVKTFKDAEEKWHPSQSRERNVG